MSDANGHYRVETTLDVQIVEVQECVNTFGSAGSAFKSPPKCHPERFTDSLHYSKS